MARLHSEALGNVSGSALSIETGSTRNPRARVLWVRVENRDAADAWLNFYRSPAADVTPGTDRYGEPIHIPPSSAPIVIPLDMLFQDELSIFASSAVDGTGAPATGLRVDVEWERLS